MAVRTNPQVVAVMKQGLAAGSTKNKLSSKEWGAVMTAALKEVRGSQRPAATFTTVKNSLAVLARRAPELKKAIAAFERGDLAKAFAKAQGGSTRRGQVGNDSYTSVPAPRAPAAPAPARVIGGGSGIGYGS